MKIAILTDIHEDITSLERVFYSMQDIDIDKVVCLGDITGYSPLFYSHQPDANACIDLLRKNADIVVAGNHDLFTASRLPSYHIQKRMADNWYELTVADRLHITKNKVWLYQDEVLPDLSEQNMDFLQNLKEWETLTDDNRKYLFSHFFHPDMSGVGKWFPFNGLEIKEHFRFMKENNCRMSFVGHSHPPGCIMVNKLIWTHAEEETIQIKTHHKAVICPAVTRGKHPGGYIVFDTVRQTIKTIIVNPGM